MQIKKTIFFNKDWRWSSFLKYSIDTLLGFKCFENQISPKYKYDERDFGSKKNRNKIYLASWASSSDHINFARSVCIESSNFSVLNFLIVPNHDFNMPFFGLDLVTLPKYHLLVLDFQPSISIKKQFSKRLLSEIIALKNVCHEKLPIAEEMSGEVLKYFSPGMIWSKLPHCQSSDNLISNQLLNSFKDYLDLYLKTLYSNNRVNDELKKEIIHGQKDYLEYRKNKDPARPMLINLFGNDFTESLIKDFLFKVG